MVARIALLLALALAACSPTAADDVPEDQWRNIEVTARPVALGAERVGKLVFRGGLALSSDDAHFGGISGVEVLEDGQLMAVTDRGWWFAAQIGLSADGRLTGISKPRVAPMRDENGEPFRDKLDADAEDIAQLSDGRFAVSFEQSQSIRLYDFNRDGPFGAAQAGPALAGARRLSPNNGIEALVVGADGALVAGAERGRHGGAQLWRAPVRSAEPAPEGALYPLEFGFGLVALDRLPDGDFVALERLYAPVIGAKIRVSRIGRDVTHAGEAIGKSELALLEAPLAIDNFEAISVTRAPSGGVRLYMMSDDNFSPRYRTLLYAFDVVEDAPAAENAD